MNVINEIPLYEKNGKDCTVGEESISVLSHWLYNDRIVLVVGGCKYTVLAREIEAAISNAKNTGKGIFS